MPEEDLKKYIKEALEVGKSKEEIKNILLRSGWSEGEIDTVFLEIKGKEEFVEPKVLEAVEKEMPTSGGKESITSEAAVPALSGNFPSIGSLLDRTFQIYRSNIGRFIVLELIFFSLMSGISIMIISGAIVATLMGVILIEPHESAVGMFF